MLEQLSPLQLGLAFVTLSVAFVVRGIAGFGSGLIAIPILALMLPVSVVVPVVGLLDYLASSSHGIKHRSAIAWREILPLVPFSLLGVISALYLFKTVDAALLKRALGVFVLLYALYSLSGIAPKAKVSRLGVVPAGGFGGLIGTLFGTGGPFYVIYLQLRRLDKSAFRATLATVFLIDGSNRIVGYFLSGFYTLDALYLLAAGVPVMAVALYIGGHIHTSISPRRFQQAIGLLLLGTGSALLLR